MLEASFLYGSFLRLETGFAPHAPLRDCNGGNRRSLSAFWIMVANSWMQAPETGGYFADGKFIVTSYSRAIFNPDMFWSVSHMWFACIEISAFFVGAISAWYILRGRDSGFFLQIFQGSRHCRDRGGPTADLILETVRDWRTTSSSRKSWRPWRLTGIQICRRKGHLGTSWRGPTSSTAATSGRSASPPA